jgi:hypothetical protein
LYQRHGFAVCGRRAKWDHHYPSFDAGLDLTLQRAWFTGLMGNRAATNGSSPEPINRIPDDGQRGARIELEPNDARKVINVIDHFVRRSASTTYRQRRLAVKISVVEG